MMSQISRWILNMLGWKIINRIPPNLKKYIIAVVPHTSNWDFPLGLLVRSALGLKTGFVGKSSLFKPPYGWIFYWLGGQPVDRSKRTNYVDQVAEVFQKREEFSMTIAPEGTRKKVDKLKTGFYYIAKKAEIPIILCKFDAGNKTIDLSEPFYPGNDSAKDIEYIENYFKGVRGLKPKNSFGV